MAHMTRAPWEAGAATLAEPQKDLLLSVASLPLSSQFLAEDQSA